MSELKDYISTGIDLIKKKTQELQKYCHEYYDLDSPSISDAEYDRLFDELYALEEREHFWLSNSPTRKVQGQICDKFVKVKHSKPMLSANKTKSIDEVKTFINGQDFYCSYKLDGLTLVVIYENGELKQAITRGDGTTGEDVTAQARMIGNLPLKIPYNDRLELRGECVISWDNFNKINESLEEKYSHPRNLASGSIRQLDTNVTKSRNLSYVVFECVSDLYDAEDTENKIIFDSKWDALGYLSHLGFETVERQWATIEECINTLTADNSIYPVDGLIFEINSRKISKSLGANAHHENCRIALKWKDNLYETILRDIEWNPTRTGIISPVAIFDPVDLDGAITSRATLHNISIMENLKLGIGDRIQVYRSNMVIPKVENNLTKSNNFVIPSKCPCCGYDTYVDVSGSSKFLRCSNKNCPAKNVAKFTHFVSKQGMNIDGLSEKTVETLCDLGYIKRFQDFYYLYIYKNILYKINGFGKRSVDLMLDNIEKSRHTSLVNLIVALGIPSIGLQNAKLIAKAYPNFKDLINDVYSNNYLMPTISGLGDVATTNLCKYIYENREDLADLLKELNIYSEETKHVDNDFINGKIFCVTGAFKSMKRSELENIITIRGGKLSGGVNNKTDYLLTNDANSGSSKAEKAKKLGTKIISEEEFLSKI